jgi:hypothetical protein
MVVNLEAQPIETKNIKISVNCALIRKTSKVKNNSKIKNYVRETHNFFQKYKFVSRCLSAEPPPVILKKIYFFLNIFYFNIQESK